VLGCWCGYLSGTRWRLAYGLANATATHCLLLHLNPDWFCLLVPDRLTWAVPDKGPLNVCVCVLKHIRPSIVTIVLLTIQPTLCQLLIQHTDVHTQQTTICSIINTRVLCHGQQRHKALYSVTFDKCTQQTSSGCYIFRTLVCWVNLKIPRTIRCKIANINEK